MLREEVTLTLNFKDGGKTLTTFLKGQFMRYWLSYDRTITFKDPEGRELLLIECGSKPSELLHWVIKTQYGALYVLISQLQGFCQLTEMTEEQLATLESARAGESLWYDRYDHAYDAVQREAEAKLAQAKEALSKAVTSEEILHAVRAVEALTFVEEELDEATEILFSQIYPDHEQEEAALAQILQERHEQEVTFTLQKPYTAEEALRRA